MEPESSNEQQEPTQTLTAEQPHEEALRSTDLGTLEQESLQHEGERLPLLESEVPVSQHADLPTEQGSGHPEMVALLTALSQGLVTFKDVALCFSQDQWSDLDPTQKEFYGEYVLEEDCGIVVSLCKELHVFPGHSSHKHLFRVGIEGIKDLELHVLSFR